MSPLRTLEIKCPRVERVHTLIRPERVEEATRILAVTFSFSHNGPKGACG